jgi:CheY-like chemotaxis protein/SAM-dependent methyltransferase
LTKDMCVVGEAGSGGAALQLIRELGPDVVVMDIELPECDGIAVTQTLRAERVPAAVVILSMHDDSDTRGRACAAGAKFVGKHEGAAVLLQAIRDAAAHSRTGAAGIASPSVRSEEEAGPAPRFCARTELPQRTMHDFYEEYYTAIPASRAHAAFCENAYGKDLGQHGFVTMEQLAKLIDVTGLSPQSRALDLGCGNGMISEYLSDMTGAHITGLDYIPQAIAQARERTHAKCERLDFVVGDLTLMSLPPDSFDTLLSFDTIYFSDDYAETIRRWRALVNSNGQMAIYFSHGVDPDHPRETFDVTTLAPDKTPLAHALELNGLDFRTWDFTADDYTLAKRKKEVLEKLKAEFDAEGNSSLYENRIGETLGVMSAIESGMHARYLYHIRV